MSGSLFCFPLFLEVNREKENQMHSCSFFPVSSYLSHTLSGCLCRMVSARKRDHQQRTARQLLHQCNRVFHGDRILLRSRHERGCLLRGCGRVRAGRHNLYAQRCSTDQCGLPGRCTGDHPKRVSIQYKYRPVG